jgi:hypothetical protein
MRHRIATLILVGAMSGSAMATATPGDHAGGRQAKQGPVKPPPTHSVRGVVKAVSDTSLVLTRSSKKPSDLVFVLDASTSRAGIIAVGRTVSVRYRTEGTTLVATAVTGAKK